MLNDIILSQIRFRSPQLKSFPAQEVGKILYQNSPLSLTHDFSAHVSVLVKEQGVQLTECSSHRSHKLTIMPKTDYQLINIIFVLSR